MKVNILSQFFPINSTQNTTPQAIKTMRKTICMVESSGAKTNENNIPPTTLPSDSMIYALFTLSQSSSCSKSNDFAPNVKSNPHKKEPALRTIKENPSKSSIERNSPVLVWRMTRTNFTMRICAHVMRGDTARRVRKRRNTFFVCLMTTFPIRLPNPIHANQQEKMMPILNSLP